MRRHKRQLAVMSRGQVMEQFHPELRYGFMINVHAVGTAKVQKRSPHPRQSLIQRFKLEITQCHRHVGPMPKVRWKNLRFLECAHQRTHFLVIGKVARFYFRIQTLRRCKSCVEKQHDDCANDRHDEPGRVKSRARLRFGKEPADQATYDAADNTEKRGQDQSPCVVRRA